jgi:hypothetical protein
MVAAIVVVVTIVVATMVVTLVIVAANIVLISIVLTLDVTNRPRDHRVAYGTPWPRNSHQTARKARAGKITLASLAPRRESPKVKGMRRTWYRK